jgi:hypothetical protein
MFKKFREARHNKRLKVQMKKAAVMLMNIDRSMDRLRWPHWKRKQFWRDFVKSPKFRDGLYKEILNGGK